jgi:adenine-specific DNA-methyltransferase
MEKNFTTQITSYIKLFIFYLAIIMDKIAKLTKDIINFSDGYTKFYTPTKLKDYTQYFTLDQNIIDALCLPLNCPPFPLSVLEPSFGTGRLLCECLKYSFNGSGHCSSIDAVELDVELYEHIKPKFENYPNINFINADFLTFDFKDKKYDLIIGNPPHFQVKLNEDQRKEYSEAIYGRTNIYSLFIYKSVTLLKPGGELRFIVPNSIISGKYFSKLRTFVDSNCSVVIKTDKKLKKMIILCLTKN